MKDNPEAFIKAQVDPVDVMKQQGNTLFYYSSTASLVKMEASRGLDFLPIQGLIASTHWTKIYNLLN